MTVPRPEMEENVFHGHQERHVDVALRLGDVFVTGLEQLEDGLGGRIVGGLALQGLQGGTLDDRDVVAGKLVLVEQLADFHLDQLQELFVRRPLSHLFMKTTMAGTPT